MLTVDEFLSLKKICEPRHGLSLEAPLTDELINEVARCLPVHLVHRLEVAKNVPSKEWPTLVLPRKDGLGNIKPDGVAQAVRHAFWKLMWAVEHVAREKATSEPVLVRPAEDGTVQCPWCGRILVLPKETEGDASRS